MSGTMYLSPTPYMGLLNNNGQPLVGGQMFTFAAGTTSPQAAFTDSTGDTPLPNPIILNLRGDVAPSATGTSCGLWLDPTLAYKIALAPPGASNPPTNSYWTLDNVVSANAAVLAALAQYEATLGGVQIGAIMPYGGSAAPAGWLLCYGQAISRTTYALLFAAIGTAFGIGDGTTTFNLPDLRGRALIGQDNMGGSAANRVTNAVSGIPATTLGASGGSQLAQADTLSATSAAVSTVTDPEHSHTISNASSGGGYNIPLSSGSPWGPGSTGSSFTGIAVATSVTTTVTSSLTGASQNMIPVQVSSYMIYTAVP